MRRIVQLTVIPALLLAGGLSEAEAQLFGRGGGGERTEHIIVSGGPALRQWENLRRSNDQHDRWWGNFVRTAKIRMKAIFDEQGKNADITWLVYRSGYSRRGSEQGDPLVSYVQSVRDDYFRDDLGLRIKLVWFESGEEVINYINSGRDRKRVKVGGFEYFGHSNKHAFMFDYSNWVSGASKSWLHEVDLKKISRRAFAKDAYCQSWGCHSAESFCAVWKKETGTKMWGAQGKTDYSVLQYGKLPEIVGSGRWKY